MSNLTLSIEPTVLRAARLRAVREDTSVNAEVRAFLSRYALGTEATARREAMERLIALSETLHVEGMDQRTWTRDDLHDR